MSVTKGNKRVLIAAKDREVRDRLRQVIISAGCYDVAGVAVDGREAIYMASTRKPDVAVILRDLPIHDGLKTTEMIGEYAPSVKVIVIGNGHVDNEQRVRAMLAGARACISSTEVDSKLLSELRKILPPDDVGGIEGPWKPCIITAVTGGRGGIGKSTVASTLAKCLETKCPGKVLLVDMYTQFGDIATILELENVKSFADLESNSNAIDMELLESYMSKHKNGLKVLVASKDAIVEPLNALLLDNILQVLKTDYEHVVIDLPPQMYKEVLSAIEMCHKLLIVANRIEVHTITDGKKLLDHVAPKYIPLEQVGLVVNRESRGDSISIAQVEQKFGMKAIARLPDQDGLDGSQVQPGSKLWKAVYGLAEKLNEESLDPMAIHAER